METSVTCPGVWPSDTDAEVNIGSWLVLPLQDVRGSLRAVPLRLDANGALLIILPLVMPPPA